MPDRDAHALGRWRLVLGRFAESELDGTLEDGGYAAADRLLDELYGRTYRERGLRDDDDDASRGGGQESSVLTVPKWLAEVRDLFPEEVCETVTRHALERFGMTELVTDPATLASLEPDYELLKAVLAFRGMMRGPVLDVARDVVRRVVEDLRRRLEHDVRQSIIGRADRTRRSRFRQARNLHLARTLRASLKHYDPEERRLTAADLHFLGRVRRQVTWDLVILVDCSGSMMDSVIHSAVMAGIFHALPSLRVRLIAFDTNVVDLTEHVDDPVEVLMSVQLGGGTDIAGALRYAASCIEQPHRTIVVLVSDFYEGGNRADLLATIKMLRGGGTRVWGLTALDAEARPVFDEDLAAQCVEAGADVAAVTPDRLCDWIAKVIG